MKTPIYWDTYGLQNPNSGVFNYALSLYQQLNLLNIHPIGLGAAPPDERFRYLEDRRTIVAGILSKTKLTWPIESYLEWKRITRVKHNSIFHGLSNFNIPYFRKPSGLVSVLTIHDLIPLLAKDSISKSLHQQMKILTPLALRHADKIICVSQWTKRTVCERFPFAEGKCVVVRNGIHKGEILKRKRTSDRVKILTVSRCEPYKNLDLLPNILKQNPLLEVHIVTDEKGRALLSDLAQKLGVEDRIKLSSALSNEDLKRCYRESDVYLHPSLYEGFCLPAGEAMQHGLPVVYRKGSALDELVSDKLGVGLEPTASASDWSIAVCQVFEKSNSTEWKFALASHLGALPSWKDCAKAVKSIYEELA